MRFGLLLTLTTLLSASDWPAFRGPNSIGIPTDDKAPADLSLDKGLAWKTPIPAGLSSPIVIRDRVFLTGWQENDRIVLAIDAATGKEAWKRTLPKLREEFAMKQNGHAAPSMATDGSSVFAFFHDIGLLSFTFDGKERWRVPLGPFASTYGLASSLTYGERMVFLYTNLQEESLLRAYDAASGELRWSAKQLPQVGGGYSTPIIHKPAQGPTQIVVFGAKETIGYQLQTGERIWWANDLTGQAAATPIISGNTLYVVSHKDAPPPWGAVAEYDIKKDGRIPLNAMPQGNMHNAWKNILTGMDKSYGNNDGVLTRTEYDQAFAALSEAGGLNAVTLGKGDLTKSVVWRYTKSMPFLSSPLLYRNVLYTIKEGGILTSFDPADGKVHKQGRLTGALGDYWSSPVAADGKLFFVNVDGKLSTVRAAAQWEPMAITDLAERVTAVPALASGRLIIRGENHLFCFGPK
jgi:outer membrane protein assembly factor BamB